jgi:hypothetical protein
MRDGNDLVIAKGVGTTTVEKQRNRTRRWRRLLV